MGTSQRTGQIALANGMYLCSGDCGTLIKLDEGDVLPWCMYCLARVEWRYLSESAPASRVTEGDELQYS